MSFTFEEFEHAGYTIKFEYEEYVEDFFDPRKNNDGILGVMMTAHRSYEFGGALHGLDTHNEVPDFVIYDDNDEEIEISPEEYVKREFGARVVFPLGLIDHSGISMYVGGGAHWSDSAGWDSGTVGIYFDSAETRKKCGVEDWTDDQIRKSLEQEIDAYDSYLRGDVFGYVIEDSDGELVGGIGGFLGSDSLDYARQEAKDEAEMLQEAVEHENQERLFWEARGVMTND